MKTTAKKNALSKTYLLATVLILTALGSVSTSARTFIDDTGRNVTLPDNPIRIASLHDSLLTIPLLELGVFPVASNGRVNGSSSPFIRGSKALTGYDFDNSNITFVGTSPVDVEKLLSVKPDLIITTPWQKASLEQLEAIAPTVVLDYNKRSRIEMFEALALLTNSQEKLIILKDRYQEQINRIKRIIKTQDISVNVIQATKGKVLVWNTYFNLGKVLRDSGFKFPQAVEDIAVGERVSFGAEKLQSLDADYLFVTYRTDKKHTPIDAIAEFEAVVPNFCNFLTACKEGRMLVMPREEASSSSFTALGIIAYNVLTHISGKPYLKK